MDLLHDLIKWVFPYLGEMKTIEDIERRLEQLDATLSYNMRW